jgi:DNA mismatch repair protein MSH6
MSGQKPKQQQQANLFSFFKKSDAVPKQTAGESVNPVAAASKISSLPPSAEKKTPSLSSDTMAKKVQSPEISQASTNLTDTPSFSSTKSKKEDDDLQDSDDDSFALGKKRRLQKTTTKKQPSPDSASKKQKLRNPATSSSTKKVAQPVQKKGTIHNMDEDDEDAEFDSSSSDDEGSAYSEDSEDDSSMDVDESDDNSGSDSFIDDSDDDDYDRKSKKPAAKVKRRAKGPATKASIPKPPMITPRKTLSTASLPSSVRKTPGAKSSTSTPLSAYAAKTPDRFPSGEEDGGNSPSTGSQPPSASKFVLPEGVMDAGKHDHDSYEFLFPEKIRDANNRRPGDIGYNPRTLKVPASVLAEQTPAMAQWWQFKAQNMDTVLFFKVGKFYELFHMDADIGFKELDLIYMKGTKAHSGFPETSYGRSASILVSKGYRVARVEQTETPDMLKERNQTSSAAKKDKVVTRELCSIMTKGTRTFNHLDDLSMLADTAVVNSSLLMCICEFEYLSTQDHMHTHGAWTTYGICVIDTVISTITVAQFQDDRQRTRLRTMLARFSPTEVLLELGQVSEATKSVVKLLAPAAAIENLRIIDVNSDGEYVSEMPLATQTLQMLAQGHYFPETVTGNSNETIVSYPHVIQYLKDAYERNPEDEITNGNLALRAIGGCLWQLKRSRIDHEIVSMGAFAAYVPPDDQLHVDDEWSTREEAEEEIFDSSGAMQVEANENYHTENNQVHSTSLFSASNVIDLTTAAAAADKENSLKDPNAHLHHKFASAIAPVASSIMILDETTLSNLEILHNTYDQTDKHSLWEFINHSITWGGARLLKSWLCHPLFAVYDIALRQEAVEALLSLQTEGSPIIEQMHKKLRALPDLERLLLRVHANGLKKTLVSMDQPAQKRGKSNNQVHPDHRAIMFESSTYTMRKIKDFADIITGLEVCAQVISYSISNKESISCWAQSRLLHYLLAPIGSSCTFAPLKNQNATEGDTVFGTFPLVEVNKQLRYFRSIFDEQQAKKTGQIQPKPGINPEYDTAMQTIANIQQSLQSYLQEMKRTTGIFDMVYFGTGKDRYQLEIPMNQVPKVPGDWQSKSQKKTHRRYWTTFLNDTVTQLLQAEEQAQAAQQDTLRQLFATFDQYQLLWRQVGRTMSIFDALCALKRVSQAPAYTWPDIQDPFSASSTSTDGVSLEIINGRHPMLEQSLQQAQNEQQCIPNSLQLGGKAITGNKTRYVPKTMVLTGPNMGGKSTLLRMTCLVALLGQLGCKVPASQCRYAPIDRIFTRLGACDKLLAGQSTFFVEMAETSLLLRAATNHSLCILDELGRGTATYDGTAIAHAVLTYLVQVICPRVIFATHYHLLVEDWSGDPRVQLGHMDCLVQMAPLLPTSQEKGSDEGEQEMVENVTFLYRLCAGASPKSYGLNVARLAGLPVEVIRMALAAAASFTSHTIENSNAKDASKDNELVHAADSEEILNRKDRLLVAVRVMYGLLEHLVSLAQTQIPSSKNGPGVVGLDAQRDQAMNELVVYAQELYERYQHLYQHHHVDELIVTIA